MKETFKTNIDISNYFGFVYKVTELSSDRIYIGSKQFVSFTVPKGKVNKVKKESNWRTYRTSNKYLKLMIKKKPLDYKLEIISLCKDKSILRYEEAKQIMIYGALENNNFNGNIKLNVINNYNNYNERVISYEVLQ